MKTRLLCQRIWAVVVSFLLCCTLLPTAVFAGEDDSLYGITATDGSTITVSELTDSTALNAISEAAALRWYGMRYTVNQYVVPSVFFGDCVLPFSLSASNSGFVSIEMNLPDPYFKVDVESGDESKKEKYYQELLEMYGVYFKIAVQDASDSNAPVMFFSTTVDRENNKLTATIPVGENGVNCSLAYVADETQGYFHIDSSDIDVATEIYENVNGNNIPYCWNVKLKHDNPPPSGIYKHVMEAEDPVHGMFLIKPLQGMSIDITTIRVDSSFFVLDQVEELSDGTIKVTVKENDVVRNENSTIRENLFEACK